MPSKLCWKRAMGEKERLCPRGRLSPLQQHYQFTMRSVRKEINCHSLDRLKRLRLGHRLESMTCQPSITHIPPSLAFAPFLSCFGQWCAQFNSVCHQCFRITRNVPADGKDTSDVTAFYDVAQFFIV